MKDDIIYLWHMMESIKIVKSYVAKVKDEDDFLKNEILCDAVVRRIEIIGEAASKVSINSKNKNKQIPWRDIIDTRNLLIHGYFGVSYAAVWNIVEKHIPDLEKEVKKLIKEI